MLCISKAAGCRAAFAAIDAGSVGKSEHCWDLTMMETWGFLNGIVTIVDWSSYFKLNEQQESQGFISKNMVIDT